MLKMALHCRDITRYQYPARLRRNLENFGVKRTMRNDIYSTAEIYCRFAPA